MKYTVVHSIPGRMRIHTAKRCFSKGEAYGLERLLNHLPYTSSARVNYRTGAILLEYEESCKEVLLRDLANIKREDIVALPKEEFSPQRELKEKFEHDVFDLIFRRLAMRMLFPSGIRNVMIIKKYFPFFRRGLHGLWNRNVNVEVLDAVSIGVSLLQGSYSTASSVMMLLSLSEIMETYTKDRVRLDLSDSLAVHVDKVWRVDGEERSLVPIGSVEVGDCIAVQTGMMIPVDGTVVEGIATVDESSMTGESVPAEKSEYASVYAGTVISEGNLVVRVEQLTKNSRISKIVDLIDSGEERKASIQSKAEHTADSLAPYSFLGAGLVYLLTRNPMKALSVLMVDYSCVIKLSTPISVITAIQQASNHDIMVKGGKYLEIMSDCEVVVFDKTGTLTSSSPTVTDVVAFEPYTRDEVLRISACIEEHFPHSVAKAIVQKSFDEGLNHKEEHAEVEYVVAHGITTTLHGKKTIIGSQHFVFEDENTLITEEQKEVLVRYQDRSSLIYLGIDGNLAGFICIDDPPRPEAKKVIETLKSEGVSKVWMITGDGKNAATYVANELGIDDFRYQVLPEHKVNLIEEIRKEMTPVAMVGDGINDSPALSMADVSIAMKDASDIAREVSDVVIMSNDLGDIVYVKRLGNQMLRRIHNNFRTIVASNTMFLLLGLFGMVTPRTTALLHNTSTMLIALHSMRKYEETQE
jgi:heavy metal translocating P-type ATPase